MQALNTYDGAVVLVSHDAHLVELVADRLWLVADNGCEAFEGDLADYRDLLMEARRQRRRQAREDSDPAEQSAAGRKQARRERAEQRAANADLRKAVAEHEKRIEKLAAERDTIEQRLADPEVYQGSTSKLMELQLRHGAIKADLAAAEDAWLSLSERLDAAQ